MCAHACGFYLQSDHHWRWNILESVWCILIASIAPRVEISRDRLQSLEGINNEKWRVVVYSILWVKPERNLWEESYLKVFYKGVLHLRLLGSIRINVYGHMEQSLISYVLMSISFYILIWKRSIKFHDCFHLQMLFLLQKS